MSKSDVVLERARVLVGTRFLAQGRNPSVGLDCIGLALLAYDIDAAGVSDDYRMSGAHRGAILAFAKVGFRRVTRPKRRAGDLLLLRPGAAQWHLGICTGDGLIHADIISRKIVERPGPPEWPVAAVLRPRVRAAKGG